MTQRPIPSLLADILHYAGRVREIYARCGSAESLASDALSREAILWNFVVIGEVCVRLGQDFHEQHPDIPWYSIIGQRNVIAHGYDVFVWERLIPLIESDLPNLIEQVEIIARQFGPPPQD